MNHTVAILLAFTPNQHRTIEQFLLRLVAALQHHQWRTVFVFSGEPSAEFRRQLDELESPYTIGAFPLGPADAIRLENVLRPYGASAMITIYMSSFNRHLLRLRRRLGIERWIVFDRSSGRASHRNQIKRALARLRGWYVGHQISRIFTVSEYVALRDAQEAFLPRDKIQVIYSGIDLNRFRPPTEKLPSQVPVIGYIGQLIPEKGVKTLLTAIRLLRADPNMLAFNVRIAGQGHLEEELRRCCYDGNLSNVEFLGQVSDVAGFHAASTITVVPSEWEEAAALVILEAMGCGACLVVSDAGGNRELVGGDEEGGVIFQKGNAEELAAKLRALLKDPQQIDRRRRQARNRAERLFSLDRMVQDVEREFLKVTGDA